MVSTLQARNPAVRRRGADPNVPEKGPKNGGQDVSERKLEQGLEESMAGSDPVNVSQPSVPLSKKNKGRSKT